MQPSVSSFLLKQMLGKAFLLCTKGTILRRPQGGPREQSQHQAGWGCHHQRGVDTSVPCDITQGLCMHTAKSRSKKIKCSPEDFTLTNWRRNAA